MTRLESSSLGPEKRIKSSSDFLKILQARYTDSTKVYSEWFEAKVLFVPDQKTVRLGLTVGKKFAARAVDRNLIKRVLREAARHIFSEFFKLSEETGKGFDISLRLKKQVTTPVVSVKALKKEIRMDANLLLRKLLDRAISINKGNL